MTWDNEQVAKYTEAGEMVRHYSNARALILAFLIPMYVSVVGFVLSNIDKPELVWLTLLTEALLFTLMLMAFLYLSTALNVARKCLRTFENGEDTNPHTALARFTLRRDLKLDFFDKLLVFLAIAVHLLLYLYLVLR